MRRASTARVEKQNPDRGRGAKPHAALIRRGLAARCQTEATCLQAPSTVWVTNRNSAYEPGSSFAILRYRLAGRFAVRPSSRLPCASRNADPRPLGPGRKTSCCIDTSLTSGWLSNGDGLFARSINIVCGPVMPALQSRGFMWAIAWAGAQNPTLNSYIAGLRRTVKRRGHTCNVLQHPPTVLRQPTNSARSCSFQCRRTIAAADEAKFGRFITKQLVMPKPPAAQPRG